MRKRLPLLVLASCVVILGASPAPPARPPDGTYVYAVSGVPGLNATTIVIRSNPTGFSVFENLTVEGSAVSTQTDYDGQTLFPTHYHLVKGPATVDLILANGSATLASPPLTRDKLPGTAGLDVSEGLFAPLVLLPSILAADGGQPISDVLVSGTMPVIQMMTVAAADRRPVGVPTGDVESALTYAGQTETFWSNPTTHVVDRTDVGGANLVLRTYATGTTVVAPAAAPTPYPTAVPHFRSTNVSFASSGGAVLAGTLTVPNGNAGKRLPAFVFIHGSGPGTRDGALSVNPTFLDLSNALSNNGVVVLRYDKRGIAKSTGTPTEDWHALGDDARAAVAFLKRQPSVDPRRIVLLGHSEGGQIAPLIAPSIPQLAGIVLMAGPAISMDRVLGEQLPGDANAVYRNRLLQAFAAYVGIEPAATIAKVDVPILVLQGGRDRQIRAGDLHYLVDAARAAHRQITVKLLPEDDHLFLRLAPTQANDGSEYYVAAPLDPRVPQTILRWLKTLPTSPPRPARA
ncbi:MAG TPA: alpha/beta fold hydrolase [Candidatus Baltobacteraceae bacterium]